jgi:hypothetical protein
MNNQEYKTWSSADDFCKGDIIADGVVLGKTKLSDLRKRGIEIETIDFETGEEGNMFYAYLGKGGSITASISRFTYKDFEGIKDDRRSILLDKKTVLQSYNVVTGFKFELWDDECPFLAVIGIEPVEEDVDELDFVEISDILEQAGYVRIENWTKRTEGIKKYVHTQPNSNGDYVFVTLDSEQEMLFFSVNDVIECTSYITGETFRTEKL